MTVQEVAAIKACNLQHSWVTSLDNQHQSICSHELKMQDNHSVVPVNLSTVGVSEWAIASKYLWKLLALITSRLLSMPSGKYVTVGISEWPIANKHHWKVLGLGLDHWSGQVIFVIRLYNDHITGPRPLGPICLVILGMCLESVLLFNMGDAQKPPNPQYLLFVSIFLS